MAWVDLRLLPGSRYPSHNGHRGRKESQTKSRAEPCAGKGLYRVGGTASLSERLPHSSRIAYGRPAKPVDMTLIPAIAMAAYTTYNVVMSSVNLKRRKRSSDRLVRLLRTINFIDALVSVLSLQNTLIMVNMKGDGSEMLTLSAITSAAIMLAVLAISVAAMIKGVVSLKSKE